ncbi:MAG: hypothetical protein GF388_01995 [Candidatus Aegiribacteria sp.]|nr:hypothetical protein [Candidatus Aegiribacteria sp.]
MKGVSVDNKDILIGEISNAISQLLGSSAAAVMRRAGINASNTIWPDLEGGKSPEEAAQIMHNAVSDLKGFGELNLSPDGCGGCDIEFKDCAFASFTGSSGQPCGKQPICYFGFGLVEETYKRLTGNRVKVVLKERDDANKICKEKVEVK